MNRSNDYQADLQLVQRWLPSPLGPLLAVASARGVRSIGFVDSDLDKDTVVAGANRHSLGEAGSGETGSGEAGSGERGSAVLALLATQLAQYFAGNRRTFEIPLDPVGTAFQLRAWQALRDIPYGQTRSYAEQARAIGKPTAVRAVGAANGRNPLPIVVPCHRVIGADGALTGFAGGLHRKRALLELEGAPRSSGELPFVD